MMINVVKCYCLFSLIALLAGCTLSETLDVEVNTKPTLLVEYPLGDDRIRSIHSLIYDSRGLFFDSVVVWNMFEVSKVGGVDTLMTGVLEGEYRVVCYGNLEQAVLPKLEIGVSWIEDLVAALDSQTEYSYSDSLYHSSGSFLVKRGVPVSMPVELRPRYYTVDLLLQSEEDDIVPITGYSVRLESVPAGVLSDGGVYADRVCTFMPEFVTDAANYQRTSEFTMNRFADNDGVVLVLLREGKSSVRIPLLPSFYDIDPDDEDNVILPIVITIMVNRLTVTILDWSIVIEQNEDIGG